jgi:hypothetical protein
MRRIAFLVCSGLLYAGTPASAQKKPVKSTNTSARSEVAPAPLKRRHSLVSVYLGNSDWSGGKIPKRSFDSLMRMGLTAKDSAGVPGRVEEFRIYYKERNLYEDSVGNMYVNVDILTDFSKGNKLNSYMGSSLLDRTKRGDTAIFDDIMVVFPDSTRARGKDMRFILEK